MVFKYTHELLTNSICFLMVSIYTHGRANRNLPLGMVSRGTDVDYLRLGHLLRFVLWFLSRKHVSWHATNNKGVGSRDISAVPSHLSYNTLLMHGLKKCDKGQIRPIDLTHDSTCRVPMVPNYVQEEPAVSCR